MKKYYVYILTKDSIVLYVGMTENLKTRRTGHIKKFGPDIEMTTVDEYFGSKETALALETFWIRKYLDLGVKLQNVNKTGAEAKETFTFTCRPSIRKKAMKKAEKAGNTLSEVIDTLLEIYGGDKNWALPKKTVVVFGNQEIELK